MSENINFYDQSEIGERKYVKAYNDLLTSDMTSSELRLFLYLKTYGQSGNKVFPSIKRICSDIGFSTATISKAQKGLIKRGYLKVEKEKVPKGYRNNYYLLDPYYSDRVNKPKTENNTIDYNSKKQPNEENNQLDKEFEEWWGVYNHKIDKKPARQKFKTARNQYDFETIMNGTKAYLKTIKNKSYQKHPKTFLNQESFMNDYSSFANGSEVANNVEDINERMSDRLGGN